MAGKKLKLNAVPTIFDVPNPPKTLAEKRKDTNYQRTKPKPHQHSPTGNGNSLLQSFSELNKLKKQKGRKQNKTIHK